MRAADWMIFVEHLFKHVLAGSGWPDEIYTVICEFFGILRLLARRQVSVADLDTMSQEVQRVMENVEQYMPQSEMCIVFHLISHIPATIQRWGPVRAYWMFPFERYISFLVRCIKNRRSPEASLCSFHAIYTHGNYDPNSTTFQQLTHDLDQYTCTRAEARTGGLSFMFPVSKSRRFRISENDRVMMNNAVCCDDVWPDYAALRRQHRQAAEWSEYLFPVPGPDSRTFEEWLTSQSVSEKQVGAGLRDHACQLLSCTH
jgi:hypothetical protein